jgi:toxin ParE1/3/4
MAELIFAVQANADLEEITDYISIDNTSAAERLFDRILKTCRLLAASPGLGRERKEIWPHIRSFAVAEYVIFYSPLPQGVLILRVIHGSRDFATEFNRQ